MSQNFNEFFLLDPGIIYLNHGSFGACPLPVFEVYQEWQRRLERQPVAFLGRQAEELMADARQKLAGYLNVQPDEVVYYTNPTLAINMIARSLPLETGDEILTSDHEYGATERAWRYNSDRHGWRYVQRSIPQPLTNAADFVESFWGGVSARTRVIFISHITSPTALIFPMEEICRRAHQAGILTIVDGAHAPGQIPLDLQALGADLYIGACHKWLCAPKGAAFLYAARDVQPWLDPLVISWGYQSEQPSSSQFIDYHEMQGTRDLAAFLSVPAAIEFQAQHNWDQVRAECHALARLTRQRLIDLTRLMPFCPDDPQSSVNPWFGQMFSIRLPRETDPDWLKNCLYDHYRIEVPVWRWNNESLMRVSIQAYNTAGDAEALLAALEEISAQVGPPRARQTPHLP